MKQTLSSISFRNYLLLLLIGLFASCGVVAQESGAGDKSAYHLTVSGFWAQRGETEVATLVLPLENGQFFPFSANLDAGQGGGFGVGFIIPYGESGMAISVEYDMTMLQGDWSVSASDEFGQATSLPFLDGLVLGFDVALGLKLPLGNRFRVTPFLGGSWRVLAGDTEFVRGVE